jgi:Cys-tRNA(Pro)/Cys-tRNA(Cys) deacylase
MACVPADAEIDLKKLAAVSGNKKVELVAVREIQSLTGYIRGGVSPLGTRKQYPLFLDRSALESEVVSVSAGKRGLQILLAPRDLVRASGAELSDLTRDASVSSTKPQ